MIRVDQQPGRYTITLDRADKANALTADMMRAIGEAVRAAPPDCAIVLRSASPKLFCAGADIGEFVQGADALARQEQALLSMIDALGGTRSPVIAVARGASAGAGAILLCLADVVIAGSDLKLSCPEFDFGMYPVIVESVLHSRLWPALVQRLCCGIGAIDAAQALSLGLVAEVLPAEALADVAPERLDHYLQRLPALTALRRSRLALSATREMQRHLHEIAPAMLDNYRSPGVSTRIGDYLAKLRR